MPAGDVLDLPCYRESFLINSRARTLSPSGAGHTHTHTQFQPTHTHCTHTHTHKVRVLVYVTHRHCVLMCVRAGIVCVCVCARVLCAYVCVRGYCARMCVCAGIVCVCVCARVLCAYVCVRGVATVSVSVWCSEKTKTKLTHCTKANQHCVIFPPPFPYYTPPLTNHSASACIHQPANLKIPPQTHTIPSPHTYQNPRHILYPSPQPYEKQHLLRLRRESISKVAPLPFEHLECNEEPPARWRGGGGGVDHAHTHTHTGLYTQHVHLEITRHTPHPTHTHRPIKHLSSTTRAPTHTPGKHLSNTTSTALSSTPTTTPRHPNGT
jgi:hypothetical protein